MANSLEAVKTYLAQILDQVYKNASITAELDAANDMVRPIEGAPGTVLIPSISFSGGLADYNKTTGAAVGDITVSWEPFTLTKDRARQFTIDAVDNMESAGIALARAGAEFMRTYVVPEIDAYRFATYAGKSTQTVEATLTASDVEAAIKAGLTTLADKEVPKERLRLYISNTCYAALEDSIQSRRLVSGLTVNDGVIRYNDVPVKTVPSNRFHSEVTLSSSGFTPAGEEINFILLDTASAVQVTRRYTEKLFSPEVNQITDGWLWRLRIYHDAFVPKNKVSGIYVHKKASV